VSRRWVEVRSYELHPGAGPKLEALFETQVLPLLQAWDHDVVHAGLSAHDADAFVLIRAYASEADRAGRQDAFYGSDVWRQGPREAVLATIKAYTSAVLPMEAATLAAWRRELAGPEV
jgi:hypothetical protein